MAYELVYTSAPEGLNRGSSGFCVVACTKGLGPRLVVTLEGLSAYKPLYPHYAPNAWDNPVSRSHYIYEANGERQHILSRICFNGVDHTGRSNKLASHLVLSEREAAAAQGGPASLLLREELFKDAAWPIKAEYFAKQKEIPATAVQVRKCTLWESVMGDAGWAGYLARTYIDTPNRNVYLAYDPEQHKDILPLLHEAMSLLPDDLRWKITFNTYFVNLPAGMSCTWRCCPVDSDALRAARRSPMNLVIDITRPQALNREDELITCARTGVAAKPEKSITPPIETEPEAISRIEVDETEQTVYLDVPEEKNDSPQVSRPDLVPEHSAENENKAAVFSAWMKLILTLAAIIVFLAAVIGGAFYFVSVTREKQTLMKDYDMLRADYAKTAQSVGKIKRKASTAKTITEIDAAIGEIDDCKNKLDNITAVAEQLKPHQKFFEGSEKKPLKEDDFKTDDTPNGIAEDCKLRKADLEKTKTALEAKRKEILRQAAEKKNAAGRPRTKHSLPLEPGKTIPANKPTSKTPNKESGQIRKLSADDPRYLWTLSETFHTLKQEEHFPVKLGVHDRSKISILLLPEKKKIPIDSRFSCEPDQYAHETELETKFDPAEGVLSVILKNKFPPKRETELLIEIAGKQALPLYFKLGISRIKVKLKARDNLRISVDENVKVRIKESAMLVPGFDQIYAENNSLCKRDLVSLCLTCSKDKKLKLKKVGDEYVYTGGDPVLRDQRSRLEALESIEKEFRKDPMGFAKKVPGKLKNECTRYARTSAAVNDEKTRLRIEKLFNQNASAAPSAGELMEKIRKAPPRRKEKWLKSWTEKYDELQTVSEEIVEKLKTEIPLNKLGKSGYTGTFEAEKAAAEKRLDDRKRVIENAIRKSTVSLFFGKLEYKQFPLKDILQ